MINFDMKFLRLLDLGDSGRLFQRTRVVNRKVPQYFVYVHIPGRPNFASSSAPGTSEQG